MYTGTRPGASPAIRVGKGWRGRRELAPRCSATQLGALRHLAGQTPLRLNHLNHRARPSHRSLWLSLAFHRLQVFTPDHRCLFKQLSPQNQKRHEAFEKQKDGAQDTHKQSRQPQSDTDRKPQRLIGASKFFELEKQEIRGRRSKREISFLDF